jgi:hypothetical protein
VTRLNLPHTYLYLLVLSRVYSNSYPYPLPPKPLHVLELVNINSAIQIFNKQVYWPGGSVKLLAGTRYTYINAYHISEDILWDPQSMGRFLSFNFPHRLHLMACRVAQKNSDSVTQFGFELCSS